MVWMYVRVLLALTLVGCGRIGYDPVHAEQGGAGTRVGSGNGLPTAGSAASRDAAVRDATEPDAGATDAMRPDLGSDGCPNTPATEACNGRDDDCDGRVDEGDPSLLCRAQNATSVCASGQCALVACQDTFADCDGDPLSGCETWLGSLSDCGACGAVCELPGASASCVAGNCRLDSCKALRADCDGNPDNGCETSLATRTDCAGCGISCQRSHASASCASGQCEIVSCNDGFEDCDGDPATGCETSLTTLTDCGSCNVTCDLVGTSETCVTGSCQIDTCGVNLADCDADPGNGCETSLTTRTDCGACGTACALDHATASCTTGACLLSSCDNGWGDCDADPGNGCETSLATLTDCGACGTSCSLPNASATCASGSCEIASCDAGRADTDGMASNGCEDDARNWTAPTRLAERTSGTDLTTHNMALSTTGDVHVVWREHDGTYNSIAHSRYTTATGWSNESFIESQSGNSNNPHVAVDSAGNAMVLWNNYSNGQYRARTRRYSVSSGWGSIRTIDQAGIDNVLGPTIATSGSDRFCAVWVQAPSEGGRERTWSNEYLPGSGWGSPVMIDNPASNRTYVAEVACATNGQCVATWDYGALQPVASNRYRAGSGWNTATVIEARSNTQRVWVSMDEQGTAVAAWQDGSAVRAAIDTGSGWGTPVQLSTASNAVRAHTDIAPNGEYAMAVWQQQVSGRQRVAVRRHAPGSGWGNVSYLDDNSTNAERPRVSVRNTEALAVWLQWNNGAGRYELWSRSFTASNGWQAAKKVGAAGTEAGPADNIHATALVQVSPTAASNQPALSGSPRI